MSASAGQLVVTLTSEQGDFVSGMSKARGELDKFSSAGDKASGHASKFNAHILTSKGAISTFAAATGASAGELRHFLHAFELAPGPIGIAIAAVLALKMAWEHEQEAAKKAHEEDIKHFEDFRKLSMEISGSEDTPNQKLIENLAAQNAAILKSINEQNEFVNRLFSDIGEPEKRIAELRLQLAHNQSNYEQVLKKIKREGDTSGERSKEKEEHSILSVKAVQTGNLGAFYAEHANQSLAAGSQASQSAPVVAAITQAKEQTATSNAAVIAELKKISANTAGPAGRAPGTSAVPGTNFGTHRCY